VTWRPAWLERRRHQRAALAVRLEESDQTLYALADVILKLRAVTEQVEDTLTKMKDDRPCE
jgi:hypothetical protein